MASRATKREIERFRELVQGMTRFTATFQMLQSELVKQGYWRNLPRGNPRKGYLRQQQAGANRVNSYDE